MWRQQVAILIVVCCLSVLILANSVVGDLLVVVPRISLCVVTPNPSQGQVIRRRLMINAKLGKVAVVVDFIRHSLTTSAEVD